MTAESLVTQMKVSVPACPKLARGVALAGMLEGTGFVDQQWLVEQNGRYLQVTELLYQVLLQADGRRTLGEIASAVTATSDWDVTPDNVRQLLATKLLPLGLIAPSEDE